MSGNPPEYSAAQAYPKDLWKNAANQVPPPHGAYSSQQPGGYDGFGYGNQGYGQPQPAYRQPQEAFGQPQPTYGLHNVSEDDPAMPKTDTERQLFGNSFSDKAICRGFNLKILAFSYMTDTISSFHDTGIVLIAAGITAAVCLAISIFAIQTKIAFMMCNGLLFALVMVLFFFGWACLITYYAWGPSRIMNCVYGGIAALVFGLFLIYDTQQDIFEISPEEYIYGALQLYMDIVFLFIIILGFMGKK